jgi:pimeloyl-ACP methyl ester carboxylesterase
VNVLVNDLLTSYELSGRGKLVLMLHGWADSYAGLSGLGKSLEGYKVLAVDLPGFGGTQAPKTAWNLDDYARFTTALLDKLKLGQPYAVIGHSNGGALAIRAVSLGLLKPRKLVLLAAAGIRTNHAGKRLLLNALAKTGNVATRWMPERYRLALRKALYGAAGSDMMVKPELAGTFKKTVRQDVQSDAATLDMPVLLIYAADDDQVPIADGKRYHSLMKGSKLEIVQGAGHFVHLDRPGETQRFIKEFLK